jgi:hypothetical protein
VIYTTAIRETRGSQWNKWEISVLGREWVHEEKSLKNDMCHGDEGEKGNDMG